MKEILAEQRTPEWFEARKGVIITGSRVASWLDISPFGNPQSVMREVVREANGAEREFNGNVATDWGTQYEAEALASYEAANFCTVQQHGLCLHDDYNWIGYSPDGRIGDKLLEIKCPYSQKIPDEVPAHYLAQVQLGMTVMGLASCDFMYWTPTDFRVFYVEHDPEWFDTNLPLFKVCHKQYKKELKNKEHLESPIKQMTGSEWEEAVMEWRLAQMLLSDAKTKEEKARSKIINLAGEVSATGNGLKVTRVERQGSVDYSKVPELKGINLDQYRKQGSVSYRITEEKK